MAPPAPPGDSGTNVETHDMTKQLTINAQLDAARNAIEAREWKNASTLLDAIAERKLNKAQAAAHAELEQAFEANAPGSAASTAPAPR